MSKQKKNCENEFSMIINTHFSLHRTEICSTIRRSENYDVEWRITGKGTFTDLLRTSVDM